MSEGDPKLRLEIEEAINRHSAENGSDTPDFILAEFLIDCLLAFDRATRARTDWYTPKNADAEPDPGPALLERKVIYPPQEPEEGDF